MDKRGVLQELQKGIINKKRDKRAQVTLFIIIAIVVIAVVVLFFVLRKGTGPSMPAEIVGVENYFQSCIKENAIQALDLAGSQAGYVDVGEFVPGSEYQPFSSHLNFHGFAVPYWYYLSGNNIIREQVPSETDIEKEIASYIETRIPDCDFSQFYGQGYGIEFSKPKLSVEIHDSSVDITTESSVSISKENTTYRITEHKVNVKSKFGKFYSLAKEVYNKEKREMFLENYSIDVLRLYAPVTGIEISCSPKIWFADKVIEDLQNGLEANIQAINKKQGYKDYFKAVDTDESVNFLYSKDWPSRIEIWPATEGVMLAEPVGLQKGLGILGFCYVPYHFVYDISFPVLVQIYDENELFQFPVAVIIEKSMPRNALPASSLEETEPEICKYKTSEVSVYTYSTDLSPVEADISFKCLGQSCDIGKTKIKGEDSTLTALFPRCVNGFVVAQAEGYTTKQQMISTNTEATTDVILDKLYRLNLQMNIKSNEMALVYFESADRSFAVAYPEQNSVSLSQGDYNVTVYVYRNSSLKIPGTTTRKCIDVPRSGLFGIFGATKEQCFELNIPEQIVSFAISGGGKTERYVVESELLNSNALEISFSSFSVPQSLEQLQENYELVETNEVNLKFV